MKLEQVDIETTSYCNRKCPYCPNSVYTRPAELMEDSIFHRIIDSLSEINFDGIISPHLFGEPLSDKRIVSFVSYIKIKLPRSFVKLYTNGDYLTKQIYLDLRNAGLDFLVISKHSKATPKIVTTTMKYIEQNRADDFRTILVIDYYKEYYNKSQSKIFNNRGGSLDISNVMTHDEDNCNLVNQLTFDYVGDAILCCNDYFSSVKFGNINLKSISEIWNNPEYVKLRNDIMRKRYNLEICKRCKGILGS